MTLVIVSFVACGRASPITGTPFLAPRCEEIGYEDLLVNDVACVSSSNKSRYVDINGQRVRYSILKVKLRDGAPSALPDETVQIRHYSHVGIHSVERMRIKDEVRIYASDACLVEKYTETPSPDINCSIQSVSMRNIDVYDARVLLPGKAVDDLELHAFNSGRSTHYTLTVIERVPV